MPIPSTLDPPLIGTAVRDAGVDEPILVIRKEHGATVTTPEVHAPTAIPRSGTLAVVRRLLGHDVGDDLDASTGYERAELGRHLLAAGLLR
ncbi:hypothetical protein [Georgenia sp. Z1491]|uniref:hypothetical protein n=1 Tax=Georgenia sp. Z1491 TaxID=3416707 RepID=UPI003CEDBBCC